MPAPPARPPPGPHQKGWHDDGGGAGVGGTCRQGRHRTAGVQLGGGVTGTEALALLARRLPLMSAGTSNSGSRSVTVPTKIPSGSYFLIACADDTALAEESNETNNCRASAGRVTVG
jgi:hypothetical protein